jgi:hypothetical protein
MVLRYLFSAICKMTLYNLLVGILVAIFLGSAVYREHSWSRSNFKLRNQVIGYEKDIESLKLQLLIDELVDYKPDDSQTGSNYCILNSETGDKIPERQLIDKIDEFSISAFQEKLSKIIESTSHAVNIKKIDLRVITKQYILNWNGLLTVLLCVLVMLLEIFKGHSSTVFSTSTPLTEEEKEDEKKGNPNPRKWSLSNKYFETYIAKKKILSNFFMYPVLFFAALFSWAFYERRGAINSFLFKFLIQWMVAGYLSYFVFNFIRLMKYFPKDRDEMWKSIFKLSWWQWVLPRVFTSEGFAFANFQTGDNGIIPAVFSLAGCIGADIVCCYPYYYFYYYTDYYQGQSTAPEILEYTRRRNIFLSNMTLQLALSMFAFFYAAVSVMGSPIWMKVIVRKEQSPTVPLGTVVVLITNAALCLLRILWYIATGGSTLYACFVSLFFILHHIVNFIAINAITTTIVEKISARTALIEPFVRTFIGNHIMKNAAYYEREGSEYKTDEEVVDAVAVLFVDLFEGILDKTGER